MSENAAEEKLRVYIPYVLEACRRWPEVGARYRSGFYSECLAWVSYAERQIE